MNQRSKHIPAERTAFRIAITYALFAAVWILLSDKAVDWLLDDPAAIHRASLIKGWLFVAVTALLLFGLTRRLLARLMAANLREIDIQGERLRELQLSHAQVSKSEERFRQLFQHAPVAMVHLYANGMILAGNARFTENFGYTKDDVTKLSEWWSLAHPDPDYRAKVIDTWHAAIERAAQGDGRIEGGECTIRCKNGDQRIVQVSGIDIDRGILLSFFDVTERRNAQKQFKETAATLLKLSLAVEQSPESIVITNIEAEIEYVNDAFERTTGYSRKEVLGKNPKILNRGRTPDRTYHDLWETLTRGEVWKGEFLNTRKDGTEYVESATIAPIKQPDGTITHYVAVKEDITSRRRSEELINRLAYFDTLTTLPNRTLLLDRLEQAMLSGDRSKNIGMFLLLDIDHFQLLNDTQGHEVGDRLLQEIANRLQKTVRAEDTVARFGGDEFAVIVEHLGDQTHTAVAQAERVAEKIYLELNRTYNLALAGGRYHATPSIGITLFNGHAATLETLLQQAEVALYKAKSDGRNAVRFFDPTMQAVIESRAKLERGLRAALANNEFRLFYQPQVDRSGCVVGAEALIRWITSDGKMMSPAEFIPLAEETGLIVPIGDWVVENGCAQLGAWQTHMETRHLTLAINVSSKQFHQGDFVARIRTHIEGSGIDPAGLKLELTESVILGDIDDTVARMDQIKALGVRFALDDFGTGYSSLSYLKRLPFDQLKIDQSFVRDMTADNNSGAIVYAILAMSQSLGLEVVAEGVETTTQRDSLQSGGCDIYQGYLYGRPTCIEEWTYT